MRPGRGAGSASGEEENVTVAPSPSPAQDQDATLSGSGAAPQPTPAPTAPTPKPTPKPPKPIPIIVPPSDKPTLCRIPACGGSFKSPNISEQAVETGAIVLSVVFEYAAFLALAGIAETAAVAMWADEEVQDYVELLR